MLLKVTRIGGSRGVHVYERDSIGASIFLRENHLGVEIYDRETDIVQSLIIDGGLEENQALLGSILSSLEYTIHPSDLDETYQRITERGFPVRN